MCRITSVMSDATTFKADLERYRAKLAELEERQRNLDAERERIGHTMEHVRKMIESLSVLSGEVAGSVPISSLGITDAIRTVLKKAAEPMSAPDIMAALTEGRFDMSKYAQPISVVHTTLKRLLEKEEVETRAAQGKLLYGWKVK
jgi:hypothetical protein